MGSVVPARGRTTRAGPLAAIVSDPDQGRDGTLTYMVIMKRSYSPLVERAGSIEVPATEFKARCLAMLGAVHDGRATEIVVTKHGKPFAKLVPIEDCTEKFCGFAKHKIAVLGDVFSTGESWDAQDEQA